jgi:hypothetical protein
MVLMFAFAAVPAFAAGHDHLLTTGTGDTINVGPDPCDASTDDGLYVGWLNFHELVHFGVPGTQAFDLASNPVDIARLTCTV